MFFFAIFKDEPEFSSDEDDELTQRKHLGYEHDLNERFDDGILIHIFRNFFFKKKSFSSIEIKFKDDDFYDRTDKKRKKKGKKNDKK